MVVGRLVPGSIVMLDMRLLTRDVSSDTDEFVVSGTAEELLVSTPVVVCRLSLVSAAVSDKKLLSSDVKSESIEEVGVT